MKRKVIAVTGGIGGGKSEVVRYLATLGYATVDCDAIAKQISSEPSVVDEVARLLGSDFVTQGAINRKKVREVVFKDEALLTQYNHIFFERVKTKLCEFVANVQGTVFVEIALIDAFDFDFDEIWLVESAQQTRIDRVTARDGVSKENVEHIMKSQHYHKYTRVIRNDGTLEELKKQVQSALNV